jgi:hypothetical protein
MGSDKTHWDPQCRSMAQRQHLHISALPIRECMQRIHANISGKSSLQHMQSYNAAHVQVVMGALKIKQDELKEVVDKLAGLDAQLTAAKKKKSDLEAEFKLCSEKLERANKLIGGLGGEKARWTESAAFLDKQLTALCGDMLLSAAYIAYLGPFTVVYRYVSCHIHFCLAELFFFPLLRMLTGIVWHDAP